MVKTIANQVNNPFQHIAEIEEYIKHLLHLCSVNTFMINHNRRYLYVLSYEQNAKEIDSSKSLEWNDIVSNDFHCQYICLRWFDPTEGLRHTEFTEVSPPAPFRMERGVITEIPLYVIHAFSVSSPFLSRPIGVTSHTTPLSNRRGLGVRPL